MEKIEVIQKPEWVSWEDIHNLLVAAHQKNIARNIVMKSTQLPAEELERRVGLDGRCFVALAGDKLIGTTSVGFYRGIHWYDKGKLVAHSMFTALLPRYQGIGIREEMIQLVDEYAREFGAEMLQGDTPVENTIVRENAFHNGFVEVAYRSFPGHYSVLFVKWLDGNPFPLWYCRLRCLLSKCYTMVRFNIQGKKRFGI